jgi:ABC-type nitrate/sulfonate/bicarbonate transport system substrate-binding protein
LSDAFISRRAALWGALGLAAPLMLSACGKPQTKAAAPGGKTRIRFGHTSAAVAVSAAQATGAFERRGLELALTPITSGPAAVAATVGGALDFTFGDFLGWASALANGFKNCRLVAPANGNGNFVIVARKGIDTPQQLAGKRIGVASAPVFSLSVKLWLKQIGVDPGSVNLVLTGQGMEHALGRGDIDALLGYDPVVYRAEKLYGAKVIAGDPTEAVMPKGATRACYYVNGDVLAAHPDVVDRMVAAIHEGAREWARATPLQKAQWSAPYLGGLSPEQMQRDMPGLMESFRYPPAQLAPFSIAANQAWVDIAVQGGALSQRVDIAPFVHKTALEAA